MSAEDMPAHESEKPENAIVGDESFEFVVNQRNGQSAVYKSADTYLRIGDPGRIKTDLALHKQMVAAGFPLARVISEGSLGDRAYFIESSLGDKCMGNLFAKDIEKTGSVTQENFDAFLRVTEQFARAQLTTGSSTRDYAEFADGIHLDELCDELPEQAPKIRSIFDAAKQKIAALPFVITHGDFNPNNLYPDGVIDLEDSFHAPFGHDLVGAFSHIDYFPDSSDYEFHATYRFSADQQRQYFELLDRICMETSLPPLSECKSDFDFTRAVWLLVRMHKWPKIQKFRYDLFAERFLKDS